MKDGFTMMDINNDKEFQNALMINKNSRILSQVKARLADLKEQCNAQQLEIASKNSKALKTYSHLVIASNLEVIKILADDKNNDTFHVLEALTTFTRKNASDLRYLSLYWNDWFETLLYYLYFLLQHEYDDGNDYSRMHSKFETWLKDNLSESSTAYTLAQAYNNWYSAKVAVNDYSGLGLEQYNQN